MSGAGPDRRRHPRLPCDLHGQIVIGPGAMVFCRVIDRSAGGLCLALPPQLALQADETLLLEGQAPLTGGRICRVIGISARGCHVAFV